jgi:hypothetical protein
MMVFDTINAVGATKKKIEGLFSAARLNVKPFVVVVNSCELAYREGWMRNPPAAVTMVAKGTTTIQQLRSHICQTLERMFRSS